MSRRNKIENQVQLLPHQIPHAGKIIDIWFKKGSLAVIDTSDRGSGKTFVGTYMAQLFSQQYRWKCVVIAPNSQCLDQTNGWLDLANKHGIDYSWTSTYSSLIGRNGKCNHGYLTCSKNKKSNYEATSKFKELCANGLFLVLDECHRATRTSRSHWACAALIRECYNHGKMCRILLISNTPGDKDEHSIQLLRLTGFMRQTKMVSYDVYNSTYNWEEYGLGELVKSAKKFTRDQDKVDDCFSVMVRGAAKKISINIYKKCIGPLITSAMTPPKIDATFSARNAFLKTDPSSVEIINKGLDTLKSAVRWNGNDVGARREWSLGGIIIGLKMIELGKLNSISRYVRSRLRREPKRKFVIAIGARNLKHQELAQKIIPIKSLSFSRFRAVYQCWKRNKNWKKISKDCFRLIVSCLSEFNESRYPTIMNGKTKAEDRIKIMDDFQSDNNNCNVLIISPGVGSEAISLHDKHGNRPRTLLLIPDHFFVRTVQTVGRVYRVGTKSDAEALIVYSKESNLETSVLNCMVRKTKTARSMLAVNQKVSFPGEFPYWIEGEKNPELEQHLSNI